MSRPSPYAAMTRFAAPARPSPGARPVILGYIIVESLYRMGQELLVYGLHFTDPALAATVRDGDTPGGLLANLVSFSILAFALALVLRLVHGRGLLSLIGPTAPLWPQFRATALAVALLLFATEALTGGLYLPPGTTFRPWPEWLLLLIPGLAALLVQTGSEELFYRGYLQQHIAALIPNPAAWLILPNLAFALAHVGPGVPWAENLAYFAWAFCFGLAASDLTARSGTLAPALALHLVNNARVFLFFGTEDGPDSGLALILLPAEPDLPLLPFDTLDPLIALPPQLLLLALLWGAARLALRR
ncbi:MAG: CPBP family intramembrane glutamic endopeptidase [Paracoccaceae bacterium]